MKTTFKIIHGRIKAEGKWHGADGQVDDDGGQLESFIELDDADAKKIDPDGTTLMLKSAWAKADAGEKAKAAAIAKLEAEEKIADEKAKAAKAGGK